MKLRIPKIFKSLNELIDRFKFQLYVLCIWKNIQIYKRNKVRLCMEILWPLLFVGIVVIMRYNYGDRAYLRQAECHFYSKPLLSAGFFEFLHGYICHFNNTCHQDHVENDNFFANQTSQLSAAFLEINKFMEEEKNSTGDILIQFLSQLGQYDFLKNNKQTDKYLRTENDVKDQFSMDNFINLNQHFQDILRLPKVRRVLRHFRPLLNQFKNWISGKSTLYDNDIIAIIGGMKLICGPKFDLDNEHLEKINVETFLEEILLKPFKTEYPDMKSEFCQKLDEKIKNIPMLNKIWITIKPLFIGKLLFTPRNAATWKIMHNVNTTFERFAFYHKYARDFINSLNVAFQKIISIQGEEAFRKQHIDILSFTRHLEVAYKISSEISKALDCLNVDRIEGFSTESELIDHARHYIDRNTFFAGVVFLDMEDNKKEGPTDNLSNILNFVRYKIRMDSQKIDPTDSLFDKEDYSPRRHPLTHLKYYYHGFVILQELLDTAITDVSSNNSIFSESYIHKPRVTLQQYPHPCYNRDEFLRSIYWILPLQICLSWTLTIAIIILTMAEESKNHLHQYYRILGMNDTILILAQLATLLIPTFISSVLTALILFKGNILLYSDTLAIVLIIFNYGLTTVCLGILFGTLLRKYTVSPYIGILMYLMFTFLPYYINKERPTIGFAQRIFLWLFPSMPFLESFFNIIDLEIAQVGLQWDNIVFRQNELSMSFIDNFMILTFDAILFIGTSIMIEKAKTNFYSETYLKIWQILKQIFLQRLKKQKMDEANVVMKFIQNDLYMEKEPVDLKCSIEIINLTKATVDGKLLDNVSLKFYENQLTCLLINNCITGNALITKIMKLQQQDYESIHICENNNKDQIKKENRNIGYLPTYDIPNNELTVEENLWFYTKLKNSEMNIKTKDIDGIIKSFHLFDVRYIPVNQLPQNLIRRLCVAIAFVGKCKIILLQDPFFGIDFYSKHVLCDALADYKTGRTILMTTNHVDDARIICDKIAIINDGRLLCYGSKTFLRTIFTKGFVLRVELGNMEDIIGIARQIKFLNLPESFESDIKKGFETGNHLTNIILQITRYFIPNSYFVEAKGQKYKFIMPYIKKDGIYDCIGNNMALRKLFSLLDKFQSQTLRYEFSTLTINKVYENINLFEVKNCLNNRKNFVYEEMDSVKLHKPIQNDIATEARNREASYLILSVDSESDNFNEFQKFLIILRARFKRNYRNYKFVLQLLFVPFIILFFTTIWTKRVQLPPIIYPAPLNILLYPKNVEIFVKGFTNVTFQSSNKTAVGDHTLRALIYNNPTINIKSLGNKCVYFMEYTSTDISGCMKNDVKCHITTILNNSESSIGLDYMDIYETILRNMCKIRETNISLEHRFHRDIHTKSLPHSKCFCNDKDGKSSCPVKDKRPKLLKMSFYTIYNIESVTSLPTYLSSFYPPKTIGGFDTLTKNQSENELIKKESNKMQELLLKVTNNSTMLPLKTSYVNQMYYLRYLTYIPNDNIKNWFDNRLKTGMPSILSTYDIAYFRSIINLKNAYNYKSPSYGANKKKFHRLNRTPIFDDKNPGTPYIDIYGGNDYGFITINHPIHSSHYLKLRTIIYLYINIWIQICVTSLITTTILSDMFEDTKCYPHCFQLYKIKPLFHMLFNIMYSNWMYILAVNVCLLLFRIQFEKFNHLYGMLLYVIYGWALIPFMLTITYIKPRCSMLILNIINNGIGFLCLLLEFTINLFELRNTSVLITFLIPHYGFKKVLFILIGTTFSQYEINYFYGSEPKLKYMIKIFGTLIISGIFYYTIVCCYECNIFIRGKEMLKKYFSGLKISKYVQTQMAKLGCKKRNQEKLTMQENPLKRKLHECIVENKVKELERIEVEMSDPALYPILIKNLTTIKLGPISIKGEIGCCLGLLGLHSGITPFASLLTGEYKPFQGDIYIMGHNTKTNKFKIPNFIGYAPKDIYLNIYLTPRESIEFYTSMKYKGSAKSKKVVEFLINHFVIKETQMIKDCSNSTKRKLLLATALMLDLPILILTEPLLGLNMIDISIAKKTILDMKALGKCVIVLSNSIEDSQYYSKISIFDDKDIKCFGSIEDLRTRYANGYMVSIEFNKNRREKYCMKTNYLLAQRLLGTFPSSHIVEFYVSYIKMYIIGPNLHISRIFVTLDAVQNLYDIEDYTICLASLDEILSKFSNSTEDFIDKTMLCGSRLYDIPYA